MLKQIRRAIDKTIGDTVRVTLSRDVAERKMEAPADLAAQLAANPKAAAYFAKLAYTHQREYVRWLEGAKKPKPAPAAWPKPWSCWRRAASGAEHCVATHLFFASPIQLRYPTQPSLP